MADPASKPTETDPPTPEPPSAVREAEVLPLSADEQAWLDDFKTTIDAMPDMTETDQKRADLVGRLACVLEDLTEQGADRSIGDELLTWPGRADFEQQLEAWEAGRHPLQRSLATPT